MYINKIDELIDSVIDDFSIVLSKNKIFEKILSEPNFVKYQKEINDIFIDYMKSINLKDLKEIVKSSDSINNIIETIKKYIAIYLFLVIGYYYKSKDDTYINNIVEYTKNQSGYQYKIKGFFNSESNSQIIKYFKMTKQVVTFMESESQQKKEMLSAKQEYKDTISFMNDLGKEFVDMAFSLKNLKNDKNLQSHNIIKTLILLLLYKGHEKKEFFRLLEIAENVDGEYMFIDIVVPTRNTINFSSVESLFKKKEIIGGLAYTFWDYLQEIAEIDIKKTGITNEEKILRLINSGILVPIVDDFLLYHKDNERYDKTTEPDKIKKKEDTKIRYIVNKIDTSAELYSEGSKKDEKIKANIKKNFYVPLYNRKAVLVNDYEEIKIINKFINQGKRSVENNEYFNDLINYRTYPYINFKDFKKDGFSIVLEKTSEIIRSVSFETSGDFKQNPRSNVQMRVGSKDMMVNIVGFIIPSSYKPVKCLRAGELIDIRSLSKKTKSGNELILKYLKHSAINNEPHKSSVYWMFDSDIDNINIDTYEQVNKFNKQDQIKHIVGELYDSLITEIFDSLNEKIATSKDLYIQTAEKMISKTERKLLEIKDKTDRMNELEANILKYIKKTKGEYDVNDDIVNGMSGEVYPLPEFKKEKKSVFTRVNINLSELNDEGEHEKIEKVEGICQHNITWDNIVAIKRSDPTRFSDEMYTFIQQYVFENAEKEYVCKSCGFYLNIKKYILDGVFDDDSQRFITYSMPMEVDLRDIPEYEKFSLTISNVDRIIEKIAMVAGMPYFSGTSSIIKGRRKMIVKNTIDLTIVNNKSLKKIFKERSENITRNYGLSRDLSNLFVFELENSIFVQSSKDKDFYKQIKLNNVLSYVIILLMLEINDSQISFLTNDKKGVCNFAIFDKVYTSLFDGLKLRKNNKGDTINVKDYKIFCYILYIISCTITKYSMWHYEYKNPADAKDPIKKKKYQPLLQKIVIHTVIDLLNSILENGEQNANNHLYEVLTSKFHTKLSTTFKNDEIYNKFKDDGRTSIASERKAFIITNNETSLLTRYKEDKYFEPTTWSKIRPPKLILPKIKRSQNNYTEINNITNCITGDFHNWKYKGDTFECTKCNNKIKDVKLNDGEVEKILKNYRFIRLQDLARKFCSDGTLHQYVLNNKSENVCTKCNKTDKHEYSHDELEKIEDSIDKYKEQKQKEFQDRVNELDKLIDENNDYNKKLKEKIKTKYSELVTKENNYKYIDEFIQTIDSVIGNDLQNDKNNNNLHLKENSYIIDHDYLGYPLDKPVIITDKDNKITYKANHPFFKKDVIYYTSYKNGKVDVFYDAMTKIFLGYKEESKNFVLEKRADKKIKINHSIYNKLKFLGYISQYINIEDYKNERMVITPDSENTVSSENSTMNTKEINEAVSSIIRKRIDNLKMVLYKFQRVLTRILNGYGSNKKEKEKENKNDENKFDYVKEEDEEFFTNKMNNIVDKHKKKITNIRLTDKDGGHRIFKHWKGITNCIFAETDNLQINIGESGLVNADTINRNDESGNLILYYFVTEMKKLLEHNENKFAKGNISMFFIDFINYVFYLFNEEELRSQQDIKRFVYILNSYTYIDDIKEKIGDTEGIYEEYKDADEEISEEKQEELEDDKEEADALDVDMDMEEGFDWDGLYESHYDLERDDTN